MAELPRGGNSKGRVKAETGTVQTDKPHKGKGGKRERENGIRALPWTLLNSSAQQRAASRPPGGSAAQMPPRPN